MEPKDIRMRCPDCSWSVVVGPEHTEDELSPLPVGVTKRVNGVFYCPNCSSVGLVPVASVPKDYTPKIQNAYAMTLDDWRDKLGEYRQDVIRAEAKVSRCAEALKDAKDEQKARQTTLNTAIDRLLRVPEEPKPLLDIAESAPAICGARYLDSGITCDLAAGHDGDHAHNVDDATATTWEQQAPVCNAENEAAGLVCSQPAGHAGDHIDSSSADKHGEVGTWPQTAVEQAANLTPFPCHSRHPDGFACTLLEGHEGDHQAAGTEEIIGADPMTWPQAEASRVLPMRGGKSRSRKRGMPEAPPTLEPESEPAGAEA